LPTWLLDGEQNEIGVVARGERSPIGHQLIRKFGDWAGRWRVTIIWMVREGLRWDEVGKQWISYGRRCYD